ncbi:MAG: hypothetical protein AAF682_04710 [Planctomycetota bacterium]
MKHKGRKQSPCEPDCREHQETNATYILVLFLTLMLFGVVGTVVVVTVLWDKGHTVAILLSCGVLSVVGGRHQVLARVRTILRLWYS